MGNELQLVAELDGLRQQIRELDATAEARQDEVEWTRAALRASEQRYRALYDHIPLMYFTLDPEGSILSVNAHGAEELGYHQEELHGRPVLDVFHPDDHQAVEEQLQALLGRPGQVARWEFRKVRKGGGMLWVREAARTVRDADGKLVVLVVCEDVTEYKEADARLADYRQRLQALNAELVQAEERERRRIAADLHDQVGQILSLARIKLGQLKHAARSEAEAHSVEEIRELLGQAVRATGSLTFELGTPVLYELGLEAAIEHLTQEISERHDVQVDFSTTSELRQLDDEAKIALFRAARELLLNVVKHARAESVRVTIVHVGERIHITVADDGVGFDPASLVVGKRADGGFGLFSIRERLTYLGGTLELDSSPGEGTRAVLMAPTCPS